MQIDPITARVQKYGIAALTALDGTQLAIRTMQRAPMASSTLPVHPWIRELALSAPALLTLAAASVLLSVGFARSARSSLFGAAALLANRLLLDAFGSLDGVFDETTYHGGAALFGWVAGATWARLVAGRREGVWPTRADQEALAALGAAATFGATYLNAGLSKLRDSGLTWADSDTIRLMVISHRPVGVTGWTDGLKAVVIGSPHFAMALAIGTLLIQLGAAFFPWTRGTRAIWGTLFVSFHLGIHILAQSILFFQAVILAVLFAYPWGRWLPGTRAHAPSSPLAEKPTAPGGLPPRAALACGVMGVVLAAMWTLSISPRRHPIERLSAATSPPPRGPADVEVFGPLSVGLVLADDWRIGGLRIGPEGGIITVTRAEQEVLFDVSTNEDAPAGPFDAGGFRVSYRPSTTEYRVFAPAGEELARRLVDAAGNDPRAAFQAWVRTVH